LHLGGHWAQQSDVRPVTAGDRHRPSGSSGRAATGYASGAQGSAPGGVEFGQFSFDVDVDGGEAGDTWMVVSATPPYGTVDYYR
jgi:hypothetical protein